MPNDECRKNDEARMMNAKSTIEPGEILNVVSGEFAGFDVIVLSVDKSSNTARVALAVFGGIDAVPFEIELDALAHNGSRRV